MKIVVISPTYNEKVNMEKMIPLLEKEVFPKVKNHTMYLLIADDKSPDGTADVVRSYMKQWKNIELLEGDKQGLGSAYIRAMKYAMEKMHADAVIEFDADFQHDPHDIPRLIKAMDEGADYVIGSRYIPGGQIPKEWGFDRKIKSIFGSLFARIVWLNFNIHDMTSGFKLTKTAYLKKVNLDHLYSKDYAYKLQILYEIAKLGAKVKEVPIIFYERTKGKSKMDTNNLYDSFALVVRLRLRDSQRFIRFLIVGGTGFVVQIGTQEGSILTGVAFGLAGLLFPYQAGFFHDTVAGLGNAIAVGIGAESAIISNFLINNFWTFGDTRKLKESSPGIIRLLKFNLTSLASILVQVLAVSIAINYMGTSVKLFSYTVPVRIAILIPTIILVVIPLNYLIYNKIIWKTQYLKDAKNS